MALSGCCLWNAACVNQISDEIQEGDVAITFTAKVGKTSTKVADTAFDKGDEAGLFAVITASDLEQRPYIDNLRLVCGDKSTLIPEKTVFYPEGDLTLDFISYYPYHPEGKTEGTTIIPVSVEEEQSDTLKRSASDFLIARKSEVGSSAKAVELEYRHKFAKIGIVLTPGPDEEAEEMLKANPQIIATGFKTRAGYDLEKDEFVDLNHEADITAFGKWSIKDDALVGKEFIVIPQETNKEAYAFTMEWNGRLYNCAMPDLSLESGMEYTISISSTQADSDLFQGIVGAISDWLPGTEASTDNQKEYTAIHLAALSFKRSNVYRVYNGGKPVAEVCKEYLRSEELSSRAIVAYPVLDNEETDLSQGVVLQLLDQKEPINGGKISWNQDTNSFNYQKGSSAPISRFYLNAQREILLESTDDAINVNTSSYTLRDFRNGELEEYPIVKIGTQYWMKAELRATTYRDGKALAQQTNLGERPGYFNPEKYNKVYLYNGEALLNGKLNPVGWRIPSGEDWAQLKEYVNDNAASLKTGEWNILSEGTVAPVSNLAMFSAYPVGMWFNGKHYAVHKMVGFWSWDETTNSIPEQTVFFTGEGAKFILEGTRITNQDYYKALSVRCIKE